MVTCFARVLFQARGVLGFRDAQKIYEDRPSLFRAGVLEEAIASVYSSSSSST